MHLSRVKVGDKLQIQCYKHNQKIHRAWSEAVVLEIKKDYIVFGNNRTVVTEREGSTRKTKEPAIMYFYRDKWYNVICQLKKDGIYYYCNIASPFIIEENTIKYIDYDLDLRIFPNKEYKILDRMEYNYHKKLMNYSDDLCEVIEYALKDLIKEYKKGAPMFLDKLNLRYYEIYKKIKLYE